MADGARNRGGEALLVVGVACVALLVVGVVLGAWPELLKPTASQHGGLGDFINAVNNVKGPATIAMGSLSGVGLALGGGLLALGQQTGVRVMAMSAAAGGGVLLGNGLIA